MKKLILIYTLTLLSCNLNAQKKLRDSVHIKTDIYEIIYSEKLEQPLKVTYKVLCPNGTASRAGMDFYTNDTIKTSDNKDYINNQYDKGHMSPGADFNCNKEMLYKTFSYLNCALQHENLNRGVWKLLESHERELALKHKVVVVEIKCIFTKSSVKLPSGATIPDGFYKTIKYNNFVEKYYFKNESPSKRTYSDYLIH
jgi:endonuclease G